LVRLVFDRKLHCIHSINNIAGTYFIRVYIEFLQTILFILPTSNILYVSRRHISRVLILSAFTTHVRYGILRSRCKKYTVKSIPRFRRFWICRFTNNNSIIYSCGRDARDRYGLFRVYYTVCTKKIHEIALSSKPFSMKISLQLVTILFVPTILHISESRHNVVRLFIITIVYLLIAPTIKTYKIPYPQ